MKNWMLMLSLALCLGVACDTQSKADAKGEDAATETADKLETLEAELMKIHNADMAQMGTMRNLKKELAALSPAEEAPEPAVQAAIDALTESHEAMMDWMRNYRKPGADTPEAEAEAYLKEQKTKMEAVSRQMQESIEQAEALLKK